VSSRNKVALLGYEQMLEWQRSFHRRLRIERGPVKNAFDRLCNQNCDPEWLERNLLRLRRLPYGGRQPALLRRDVRKQLTRLVDDLEYCYQNEEAHRFLLISSMHIKQNGDIVPDLIHKTARVIHECLEAEKKVRAGMRTVTAWSQIAYVVRIVEERTGSTNYSTLSVLISAVFSKKIGVKYLKTIKQRGHLFPRRSKSGKNKT